MLNLIAKILGISDKALLHRITARILSITLVISGELTILFVTKNFKKIKNSIFVIIQILNQI